MAAAQRTITSPITPINRQRRGRGLERRAVSVCSITASPSLDKCCFLYIETLLETLLSSRICQLAYRIGSIPCATTNYLTKIREIEDVKILLAHIGRFS